MELENISIAVTVNDYATAAISKISSELSGLSTAGTAAAGGVEQTGTAAKTTAGAITKTGTSLPKFKSKQRSALLARSRVCDRLQPAQGALALQGFRGDYTPSEMLKWNPLPIEAGNICA